MSRKPLATRRRSTLGFPKHPHAWPVNTREWQAQMALFERVYPGDARYFIPRMADDNEDRWYYD